MFLVQQLIHQHLKRFKMNRKILLEWYWKGWNDEANGSISETSENLLERKAYIIGRTDYIVGDDVSSVDYQTEDEIICKIVGC